MISVLVVDDSATIRHTLRAILEADPGLRVVGEAGDGASAVEKTLALRPDVVTMDISMPRQDGFEAIRQIMERAPTPILVIGAAADDARTGISYRALKLGAVEVLSKPRGDDATAFASQARTIVESVRAVAGVRVIRRWSPRAAVTPSRVGCIGLVASTGGPMALRTILSALPADFPVPILVVQHITDGFTEGLVRWLSGETPLQMRLAEQGERPAPGTVLIGPNDRHLMLSMGRVRLDESPPVRGHRPAGSLLLASLARELGEKAAGIILTGMGDDGVAGLAALRQQGGYTAAQGPESSIVFGMPQVALESGAAQHTLELGEVPLTMMQLAGVPRVPRPGRRKLLLVDDSPSLLKLEHDILDANYDVFEAHDGQAALAALEKLEPDGVVMDLDMPVMRGDEALRRMRAHPKFRRIPVVLLTAEQSLALRRLCWESGCNALLDKPLDRKRLLDAVALHVS